MSLDPRTITNTSEKATDGDYSAPLRFVVNIIFTIVSDNNNNNYFTMVGHVTLSIFSECSNFQHSLGLCPHHLLPYLHRNMITQTLTFFTI